MKAGDRLAQEFCDRNGSVQALGGMRKINQAVGVALRLMPFGNLKIQLLESVVGDKNFCFVDAPLIARNTAQEIALRINEIVGHLIQPARTRRSRCPHCGEASLPWKL